MSGMEAAFSLLPQVQWDSISSNMLIMLWLNPGVVLTYHCQSVAQFERITFPFNALFETESREGSKFSCWKAVGFVLKA